MQAYFGERGHERAHFDQVSAILDSNLEEAWGETKESQGVGVRLKGEVTTPSPPNFPKPIWRRIYDCELQNENACSAG